MDNQFFKHKHKIKSKRLISTLIAIALVISAFPVGIYAKDAIGSRIEIEKIIGEATIIGSNGKETKAREGVKLAAKDVVRTSIESYVYLGIDDDKVFKLDELSEINVTKKGNKLNVNITEGSIFFEVKEKLASDEALDINASSMAMSIRGTAGVVGLRRIDDNIVSTVDLIDGRVVMNYNDVSGINHNFNLWGGESSNHKEGSDEVIRDLIDITEFPGFGAVELASNEELSKKMLEMSGLNPNWPLQHADEMLKTEQQYNREHYYDVFEPGNKHSVSSRKKETDPIMQTAKKAADNNYEPIITNETDNNGGNIIDTIANAFTTVPIDNTTTTAVSSNDNDITDYSYSINGNDSSSNSSASSSAYYPVNSSSSSSEYNDADTSSSEYIINTIDSTTSTVVATVNPAVGNAPAFVPNPVTYYGTPAPATSSGTTSQSSSSNNSNDSTSSSSSRTPTWEDYVKWLIEHNSSSGYTSSSSSSSSSSSTTKKDVSVIFYAQASNGNELYYYELSEQTIPYGETATLPTDVPCPEGYTFAKWDGKYSNVKSNESVYAIYEPIYYNVYYWDPKADTPTNPYSVTTAKYNEYASVPKAPQHEGATFVGWNPNPNSTKIIGETNFYAQYMTNDNEYYTVQFVDSLTEDIISNQIIASGETCIVPDYPYHDGYTFIKWSQDLYEVPVYSDVVSYAIYERNSSEDDTLKNKYPVVFYDYNDDIIYSEDVIEGEYANIPKDPEREGYRFIGWDPDPVRIPIYEGTEFFAIYEEANPTEEPKDYYPVYFYDGNGDILDSQLVLSGDYAVVPSKEPVKEGYIFKRWDPDPLNTPIYKGTEFVGRYEKIEPTEAPKEYIDVAFYDAYGNKIDTQKVLSGDYANVPSIIPEKEGYIFNGWDPNPDTFAITEFTEFVPIFEEDEREKVLVSFYSDEGHFINSVEIPKGAKLKESLIPPVYETLSQIPEGSSPLGVRYIKEDYHCTFKGWKSDKGFSIDSEITEQTTFTTVFEYDVYFYYNDSEGNISVPIIIKYLCNEQIKDRDYPTGESLPTYNKDGKIMVFDYWSNGFDMYNVVNKSYEFVAKYREE